MGRHHVSRVIRAYLEHGLINDTLTGYHGRHRRTAFQ